MVAHRRSVRRCHLAGPLGRAWRYLVGASDGRYIAPRLWGRKVQPVAFGVSLYVAILAFAILTNSAIGRLLDGILGEGIGVACAAATTPGSVVKKIEVFDAAGASLGFVPVYSSIT